MTKDVQPTIQDILIAINSFATAVADEFAQIHARFDDTVTKDYLDDRLSDFVTKDYLDAKLTSFVTKDYLDDKLSDLKGDLLSYHRTADLKVNTLTEILYNRHVITKTNLDQINNLSIFPKKTSV